VRWLLLSLALMVAGAQSQEPAPGPSKTSQPPQAQSKSAKQQAAADKRGTDKSPIVVKVLPAPKTKNETDREAKEHDEKTTNEKLLVLFNGLLVAVVFLQWIWMIRQEIWMRKNVTVAENTAEAAKKSADASLLSLRPWVSCEADIISDLKYSADGDAHIAIGFRLENHGQTPAKGIRLRYWFEMLGPGMEHPVVAQQKNVELDKGLPLSAWDNGVVMFPRAKRYERVKFIIRREQIEKSIADIQPSKHFLPSLYGLVSYSYALASVSAHTWFVYDLRRAEVHSDAGTAITLDEPMSIESLALVESPMWPHYAD
jgi:hypothetical protein